MKIDSTTPQVHFATGHTQTGNASLARVALPVQPSESSASATVSRNALISASGPGDFDAVQVEHVRSAINAGTYQVSAEAIADGMLGDARAFLSGGVF